jgi:hypothetical protein
MYWGQGMLRKLWTGRLISTLNVFLSAYRSAQPAALISSRPSGSQSTPCIPPNIAGIPALWGLWFDSAPRHEPSWLIVFVLCSASLHEDAVSPVKWSMINYIPFPVLSSANMFWLRVVYTWRCVAKLPEKQVPMDKTKKRSGSSTGLLYTWKRDASRRSVWTATQVFWSQVWTRQVPASIFCFEPLTTSSSDISLWSYRLALVSTPGYIATRKFRNWQYVPPQTD